MVFEGWALSPGHRLTMTESITLEGGDLPPLSILDFTVEALGGVMASLREARGGLVQTPVSKILEAVDLVAGRFLDPGDDLRRAALEMMGPYAGFSAQMSGAVLDGMARDWT